MKKMIMTMKLPMLSCPPILDVITQGETEEKAKQNLNDALSLFLVSWFERGTLDSVLKVIYLTGESAKKIFDAIEQPPAPNERLKMAFRIHKKRL